MSASLNYAIYIVHGHTSHVHIYIHVRNMDVHLSVIATIN